MRGDLKEEFLENGYVIIDVLSEEEIRDFRSIMDKLLSPEIVRYNYAPKSSSFSAFR